MELTDRLMLVTGGAGFIGSHLVDALLHAGGRVRVLDNLLNGKRDNLPPVGDGQRLELVIGDVRDQAAVAEACRGVSVVFHLACLGVRHSLHAPQENHQVNAFGTLQTLAAAMTAGVDRFVYVSTSEVYGTAQKVPMAESHTTFPCTVYGASKLAGEAYARACFHTYQFPTVVVRPFNAFGPRCHHEGDSGEVIPKFVLRALAGRPPIIFGDGSQRRDFPFVTDIARGIVLAAQTDAAIGETLNLGAGTEISIADLATEVLAATGRTDLSPRYVESRPGDVMRLFADAQHASRLLGFHPVVSFTDGLKNLIGWYRSSGREPDEMLQEEQIFNWKPKGA
jgi:UDP-glucose 4-epimerase